MARVNSLSDFLNDVSSAIKQKLGDDKPIPASQFDTKIAEIETKGNYQQKSVTISNNGTRIFTPDANYDAIEQIEITTNVPIPQLQTKAVEITSNGNISVLPDTNYDGMTQVNLTINVPQESGSGDVKLFDTVEHMQADSTAQEGDMAIVYREELVPITEDSEFDSCIFPNTVVLDEPFTDDVYWYFAATDPTARCDGTISLTPSSFDLYETFSSLEIQYTSEDGITYTRTDGGEELQSFGTTIKYDKEYTESEGQFWNDIYGNFMKINGMVFDGLYKYRLNQPINSFKLREQNSGNYTLTSQSNPGINNFYSGETIFCGENIGNKLRKIINLGIRGFIFLSQDLNTAYFVPSDFQNLYIYNDRWSPLMFNDSETPTNVIYYSYDLTNMSREKIIVEPNQLGTISNEKVLDLPANSYYLLGLVNSSNTYYYWYVSDTSYSQSYQVGSGTEIEYDNRYILAETQLNSTSEYVYQKTFYGKNGIEIGNIANNIDDTFTDTNGEIYIKIQNYYNTLTPRILTDTDKDININIYGIPVKTDGTPLLDISNVTDMSYIFSSCMNLQTIPLLDTSNATSMYSMFLNCYSLQSVPLLNTNKVTNMNSMFSSCSNLKTIPLLDTSNVTDMRNMFNNCPSLSNESLNSILQMCINAVKIASKNKTLKYLALTQEQADICKTLSNYNNFTNAGWTTGY